MEITCSKKHNISPCKLNGDMSYALALLKTHMHNQCAPKNKVG